MSKNYVNYTNAHTTRLTTQSHNHTQLYYHLDLINRVLDCHPLFFTWSWWLGRTAVLPPPTRQSITSIRVVNTPLNSSVFNLAQTRELI